MNNPREYSVCEKAILAAMGELEEKATCAKFAQVRNEDNRSRIQLRDIIPEFNSRAIVRWKKEQLFGIS